MSFPIDLIPIPMGEVCVIVGMAWLSRFGAMINCKGQQVVVRTPSGGELIIYGEGTNWVQGFAQLSGLDSIFNITMRDIWCIWRICGSGIRFRFRMFQLSKSSSMCFRRSCLRCLHSTKLSSGST